MKRYTVGFIFNSTFDRVALVRKNRPEWQKGRWNGIGGKFEEGESGPTCIAREVSEETGLLTRPEEWVRIGLMRGPEWEVEVYALMYSGSPSEVRTMTDEEIAWYPVDQLPEEALTNIPWMVALAKDKLQNEEIEDFLVSYGEKRTALRS